ncbi:MAG: SIS domain-containing protein [Streptosporangiaceae bacterium]
MAASAEIHELSARVAEQDFWAVVDAFGDEARRWFFTGQGRSGLVAAQVAMRFMHIGRDCHVVGEATAPSIRTGDGLLVISGSGATHSSVHFAGLARAEGATTVTVSRMRDGPLAAMSDVILQVPVTSTAQLGGNLFEQTALVLLDSVVNTLAASLPDPAAGLRLRHANLQ